jgi:hypothetical protein
MATWTRGALGTVFVMSALWLWSVLDAGRRRPAPPRAWWM